MEGSCRHLRPSSDQLDRPDGRIAGLGRRGLRANLKCRWEGLGNLRACLLGVLLGLGQLIGRSPGDLGGRGLAWVVAKRSFLAAWAALGQVLGSHGAMLWARSFGHVWGRPWAALGQASG